jgi:putative hydrolase of the HAD superfamily
VSGPTHILFDFFGTLVQYERERIALHYPRTLAYLAGIGLIYRPEQLRARWDVAWTPLEERCQLDHSEFSMIEVGTAFLASELGRPPGPSEVDDLVRIYVEEWSGGVTYLDGLRDWIEGLATRFRLAVVSNTHEPDLVPAHLRAMAIDHHFEAVVLSVDLGWRKPHPQIYATALSRLGIEASQAVFVGDTYMADYVGPQQAGMTAYLIDPEARADLPARQRLDTLFDLAQRL